MKDSERNYNGSTVYPACNKISFEHVSIEYLNDCCYIDKAYTLS